MIPQYLIRRAISDAFTSVPAAGLYFAGNAFLFPGPDQEVYEALSGVLLTDAYASFRRLLHGIPSSVGRKSYKLPIGVDISYLCLDHYVSGQAGVFVVEQIHATLAHRLESLALAMPRKRKLLIRRSAARVKPWTNPECEQLDSHFAALEVGLEQQVLAYRDDTLERTLASYKDFVSSFSHEALTPIQEIRSSIDRANGIVDMPADARKLLVTSMSAIDRLRTALEAMRLLFRESEKPLQNQFRLYDLRELVARWCDIYRAQFDSKNVEVKLLPMLSEWRVRVIPEYMEILIHNLVNNGAKYSFNATGRDKPGKFIVSFDSQARRLSFVNFGVPIPQEEVLSDRLFLRGTRGRLSDDRGRVGKGMGLFLVKKVADLHEAKVSVSSIIQNSGSANEYARTEFSVTFGKSLRGGL